MPPSSHLRQILQAFIGQAQQTPPSRPDTAPPRGPRVQLPPALFRTRRDKPQP